MSKPTEYRIEHVRDLLAVPEDRIDACLTDLRDWLRHMRIIVPEIESAIKSAGIITTEPVCGGMVFVDDGMQGCSGVRMTLADSETGGECEQ